MRREVALAAVAVALAGCSSSTGKPAAAPTGQASVTTSVAATATPAAGAIPADGLTGFGATQAAWDSHHTADPDKGGVYNPDPALPDTPDGTINHDYIGVSADGGRVDAYVLQFTPRNSDEVIDLLRKELPADAVFSEPKSATGATRAGCILLTATSATVGKALGGANGASVEVELQNANPLVLAPGQLVQAALVTASKGNAPGC